MALNLGKVKFAVVTSTAFPVRQPDDGGDFARWMLSPPAPVRALSTRPGLQAVLFDLDGVLVDTARFHFLAWKRLADELGISFDERVNQAFRGVGRMECLDKLLGKHGRFFAIEEKVVLAERKNGYYLEMVQGIRPTDLAEGAAPLVRELNGQGVRLGLVSASCNARLVLGLLEITDWFDEIVDGTQMKGKRAGFSRAAEKLRVQPAQCVVIEDAEAGVKAGREAGMKTVGIGAAAFGADFGAAGVGRMTAGGLEALVQNAA